MTPKTMIELQNLSKTFQSNGKEVKAVDSVSLTVNEGEICVFLGPSGCGKSTTLKMINRLIMPTSGKVLINGEDTTQLDEVTLRRNIGYVIQQIGLFPNMTIEENIAAVPRLLGWDVNRYKARAKELLEMVALDPSIFLKRFPKELSGGQQQRVGVARALAADPPVMLMDEPFGAIDPINREVIQDEFLKMQQELKKTIMFVSHDIDEAVKMADRIAIFRAGKLVQFDTPDDLLAHPKDNFVESFVGDDRALKRLRLVKVGQVMERPAFVTPQDNLEVALARIEEHGYHHAITMVNDKRQPIGYVTKAVAETTRGYCGEHYVGLKSIAHINDDLRKIASQMFTWDTTWLPCTDDDGTLRGYISQRGITHYLGATYHNDAADLSIAEPALAAVGR